MTMKNDEYREGLRRLLKDLDNLGVHIAKSSGVVDQLSQKTMMLLEGGDRQKHLDRDGAARSSNVRYETESVAHVIIQHDAGGRMVAFLDNIESPVQLKHSERLRQVLRALCGKESDVHEPEGDIVPYKTNDEMIAAIRKLSGTTISKSNLQNLVDLLRRLFIKAGHKSSLIETLRTGPRGYRLRMRMTGQVLDNRR